jgi:hypothetical protein
MIIAGNQALSEGGGIGLDHTDSNAAIFNSIIWGNCAAEQGPQLWSEDGGMASLTCCDSDFAQMGTGVTLALNNFTADPLFCEPQACMRTSAGRYSLMPSSPCLSNLNCGTVGALPEPGCPDVAVESTTWSRIKAKGY